MKRCSGAGAGHVKRQVHLSVARRLLQAPQLLIEGNAEGLGLVALRLRRDGNEAPNRRLLLHCPHALQKGLGGGGTGERSRLAAGRGGAHRSTLGDEALQHLSARVAKGRAAVEANVACILNARPRVDVCRQRRRPRSIASGPRQGGKCGGVSPQQLGPQLGLELGHLSARQRLLHTCIVSVPLVRCKDGVLLPNGRRQPSLEADDGAVEGQLMAPQLLAPVLEIPRYAGMSHLPPLQLLKQQRVAYAEGGEAVSEPVPLVAELHDTVKGRP